MIEIKRDNTLYLVAEIIDPMRKLISWYADYLDGVRDGK